MDKPDEEVTKPLPATEVAYEFVSVHRIVGFATAGLETEQTIQLDDPDAKAFLTIDPQSCLTAVDRGQAVARMPDDPQSLYGLASVLESLGGAEREAEADALQEDIVRRFPAAPAAELARESPTRRAHRNLRGAVGGGLRPEVMMYIAGALDTFKRVGSEERQQIAFEIGMLGQGGLDINDPEQKYSLKSLPGQFSGLQLLAIMYTAFQQIDPTVDAGVDFRKEYAAAKAMGKG